MSPPGGAIVSSFDEKMQVQALDRTQPTLPLDCGVPEKKTHDYIRHGTTDLFAALNVLNGKVISPDNGRRHAGRLAARGAVGA